MRTGQSMPEKISNQLPLSNDVRQSAHKIALNMHTFESHYDSQKEKAKFINLIKPLDSYTAFFNIIYRLSESKHSFVSHLIQVVVYYRALDFGFSLVH